MAIFISDIPHTLSVSLSLSLISSLKINVYIIILKLFGAECYSTKMAHRRIASSRHIGLKLTARVALRRTTKA